MDLTATAQRLSKIDYLDGLGIAVGAREVSFVHSTKRFFRVALHKVRTLPLPEDREGRLSVLGNALADFLAAIETIPDQIVLCLPRKDASVSRLLVPETARGSLEQVIRYEVERLLPFREDDIYYDYVTTEVGAEEKRLGIVIFCFPREDVDPVVDVLTAANVQPQIVTLSSGAQATMLLACSPVSEAQQVLVTRENGYLELSFLDKHQLVASQTVPISRVPELAAFTDILTQSIARNFPGSAPDATPIFSWDDNSSLPLTVDAERDLKDLAREQFVLGEESLEPFSTVTCSALGAALQAVGERGEINVLPADRRAHREKRLSALTLVLVGCILLLGIAWATEIVIQDRRTLHALTEQINALDPQVRRVQDKEAEAQRYHERLQTLRTATRIRLTPLLNELSGLIPKEVYLTTFRFKRNGEVDLRGVAQKGSASDLVAILEASACLQNVAPKATFTKTERGETFTLGARVNPCG